MHRVETPVLVVGAGPVGMMAALLLSRCGVPCHVIDRRDGPHRAPQAHVINARTLEICRTAGLDWEELRRLATPREDGSTVRWVTTLVGEELGALPYERQGDENFLYTPTPLLNLSQHRFEPALLSHLRERGGVEVRYRHEWRSLAQDDEGVTTRVDDLGAGVSYEVRSRYVLAADGAGSPVRKSLGVPMVGPQALQSFVMIHFAANLRPLVERRPAIVYWIVDPECRGAFVAHDIEKTWVLMHLYDPETDPAGSYTEARCREIVSKAIGREGVPFSIRDVATWTMTAQIAERYSRDRVFLIGDSAHRFPPSGGMGLNSGVQDAHNLVWKLAAVMAGRAPLSLLDTYETERRPVAQANAEQSLLNAMKMLALADALGPTDDVETARARLDAMLADPAERRRLGQAIEEQREHFDMFGLQLGFAYESGALVPDGTPAPAPENPVRDYVPTSRPGARLPHAWVERDGRRVSVLDLLPYDAFTLITGRKGEAWCDAVGAIGDPSLRCLVAGRDFRDPEGHWGSVCGIGADGALLVRPDQHVGWRRQGLGAAPAADIAAALAVCRAGTGASGGRGQTAGAGA